MAIRCIYSIFHCTNDINNNNDDNGVGLGPDLLADHWFLFLVSFLFPGYVQ